MNTYLGKVSLALVIATVVAACGADDAPLATPVEPFSPSAGAPDTGATPVVTYAVSPATAPGGKCSLDAVDGAAAAGDLDEVAIGDVEPGG